MSTFATHVWFGLNRAEPDWTMDWTMDWTRWTGLYWIGRAARKEGDVARHQPIILPPCRARQCSLYLLPR